MRAICSNCKWITDIALFKRNWERFAHCHFFVISEVSDALLISATRAIFSRLLCLQSDKSESLRSLMTKERPGANPSWAKSERTNSQPCKNKKCNDKKEIAIPFYSSLPPCRHPPPPLLPLHAHFLYHLHLHHPGPWDHCPQPGPAQTHRYHSVAETRYLCKR